MKNSVFCNKSVPVTVKGTVLSTSLKFITLLIVYSEMYKAEKEEIVHVYTCRNKICT
jgi:hypothetical protein